MKVMSRYWCVIVGTLVAGCYVGGYVGGERESSRYSFSSFIEGIKSFPYDAPASKQKELIEAFPKLELGMDKESVRHLLGEPDAEFFSYGDRKEQVPVGSSWGYYLHRHEAELADQMHDRTVFAYFDARDRLYRAVMDNAGSVMEKYDRRHRYPEIQSRRNVMYVMSVIVPMLVLVISCALVLVGAVMRYRRDRHWSTVLQVIGPAILLLSLVFYFAWWSGFMGVRLFPFHRWVPLTMIAVAIVIGLVLFCAGYVVAARRDSPGGNTSTGH